MSKRVELMRERAALVKQARDILEFAEGQKRAMSQEEQNNWDAIMAPGGALAKVDDSIAKWDRMEAESRHEAESVAVAQREAPAGGQQRGKVEFRSRGLALLNSEEPGWGEAEDWKRLTATTTQEYREAWRAAIFRGDTQQRALQVDLATAGGYLVTPIQLVDQILKTVDDLVFLRQYGTVFAVPNADSLGVPTMDANPADAEWTTELATGSQDNDLVFGRRELKPQPVAKQLKISRTLLRKAPGAEAFVMSRLAYKFGITQEKAFMSGDGIRKPLGVFTASSQGISTGRDVVSNNTTTALTLDSLIDAKYSIKVQYWPNLRWIFHRDALKQLAKLKTTYGEYLWQPSPIYGQPDMLWGHPFLTSEYAPNTFTASQYVGIIGDFRQYWIADSLALEMQRLVELYAGTNQVGLIGRLETDGMPVLEEAFARIKLAAQ